jgi:hypothetical protein
VTEPTLSDVLDARGIRHERDRETEADGRRTWYGPDGAVLGRFDAVEGWCKVREWDSGRDFYVTMNRDKRTAWLAGPFGTHAEALGLVYSAQVVACDLDPRSDFDSFGTASLPAGTGPAGVLNSRLGVSVAQQRNLFRSGQCN